MKISMRLTVVVMLLAGSCQCSYLFSSEQVVQHQHPSVKFTSAEDVQLVQLVAEWRGNWSQIAARMERRTVRQCRERWSHYLSLRINRNPFTPLEDAILVDKVRALGSRWVAITVFFLGRTDTQLKNRYKLLQRHSQQLNQPFGVPQTLLPAPGVQPPGVQPPAAPAQKSDDNTIFEPDDEGDGNFDVL